MNKKLKLNLQTHLEDRMGNALDNASKFVVAGLLSGAAIVVGREVSDTIMYGGMAILPLTALGVYSNIKRYLGLERQVETVERE